MNPTPLLSLLLAVTAEALPLSSPSSSSRLVWIRCLPEARCPQHPICTLECSGTVNGRTHTPFRIGPVPQRRSSDEEALVPDADWLHRQLDLLPAREKRRLFGVGGRPVELFVEILPAPPRFAIAMNE